MRTKKDIYNDIMKDVSELLKKHLNDTTKDEDKLLCEMAYSHSGFINEMRSNRTREIIRNFALVYYATKHNSHTNLVNHWRGELITLITDIQDMETKPKPGNRSMVYNAIKSVWISEMELNKHHKTIIHKIIAKFNDENIKCSAEEYIDIAQSFIDNIEMIMKEMAYGNYESTFKFVNQI